MPSRPSSSVLGTAKSGAPITEDLAAELADEAEVGYDLSRARRGRRSLSGSSGRSPRLNFRITEDVHRRASARAASEGKTLSELARDALEQYVK